MDGRIFSGNDLPVKEYLLSVPEVAGWRERERSSGKKDLPCICFVPPASSNSCESQTKNGYPLFAMTCLQAAEIPVPGSLEEVWPALHRSDLRFHPETECLHAP